MIGPLHGKDDLEKCMKRDGFTHCEELEPVEDFRRFRLSGAPYKKSVPIGQEDAIGRVPL